MASENKKNTSNSTPQLLCTPLKLATGWGKYPKKLGLLAILMLLLLRLSIGWHFYSEGTSKLNAGGFNASPFLKAARGPFEDHFHAMVWDWDGKLRLNQEMTVARWQWFTESLSAHYGFDDKQKATAQRVQARVEKQFQYVLDLNADDIREIELGRTRLDKLDESPEREGVASLKGQKQTILKEWRQKLDPILKEIDICWTNIESDMNSIATEKQAQRGTFEMIPLRNRTIDSRSVAQLIPWFDVIVGACLLLGLFTPVAALAAAGFLFSVFLSQYPPSGGPGSTYYQLIESMACLVIASTAAGRFAGLDTIIHSALNKESTTDEKGNSNG